MYKITGNYIIKFNKPPIRDNTNLEILCTSHPHKDMFWMILEQFEQENDIGYLSFHL
jgi:hypothetical protein